MYRKIIFCILLVNLPFALFSQSPKDFVLDGTVLVKYQGTVRNVLIPANLDITKIGNGAFIMSDITSITIPQGVISIDGYAFSLCRSLASVIIPATITTIGKGAFFSCEKLTAITIPSGVVAIGEGAFINCTDLTKITIPANVADIGDGAFEGCSKLTEIIVDQRNNNYSSVDGVLFDKVKTRLIQYPAGKQNQAYIIPNGIKQIAKSAFYNCENLVSITIPPNVISVEETAFAGCRRLAMITVPSSVKEVEDGAFAECNALSPSVRADLRKRFGDNVFVLENDGW